MPVRARVAVTALPSLPHRLLRLRSPFRVVGGGGDLDVAVPQLKGAPVLNQRLRGIGEKSVDSFRRTVRLEAGLGAGRYHGMSVGWQLLSHSTRATGIQLWVAQQHGLRITIDRETVWYDTATNSLLTLPDVFTPQGWPAVERAIIRTATQHTQNPRAVRAALAVRRHPPGKGVTFGFSAAGDLVVTFGVRALPGAAEPVSVWLAGDPLAPRLTATGRSARAAARTQPPHRPTPKPPNCAKRRCVALTFDDGPGPFTAELVAELQQRKVPATFFVNGNRVQESPDLLAVVHEAGLEIGNHSTYHDELPFLPARRMKRDLKTTSHAIAGVTGRRPTLFRPPYGSRNPTVDTVAKQLGMAEILWDVDTQDWRYPNPTRVISAATGSARPGSIILLHDVFRTSVAAVPGIIDDLQRRGYTLVTVSQLLGKSAVPGQVYRNNQAPRR